MGIVPKGPIPIFYGSIINVGVKPTDIAKKEEHI
jgi:hypothetical protein